MDGAGRTRTRRGSTAGRRRTASAARRGRDATRSWTSSSPTTPRRPAGCAAGTRAPDVGASPAGPRRTPAWRWYADRRRRHRAPRRRRPSWPTAATPSASCAGCSRRRRRGRRSPAASACTSGRWSTATDETPAPGAAAPRAGGHGRRRRGAPDPRAPTSTPSGSSRPPPSAAQPPAADPGDASPSWSSPAACTPAWTSTSGPTSSAPPTPGELVADCFELAARDPRAGHAGLPVRPARPRLRAGRDRDARGQGRSTSPPSAASPSAAPCCAARAARRSATLTLARPARRRTVAGVTSTRTGRWVRLDGTTNTRDLGGLPTTDGGRTVPGRILRSDNLQTLSEDDVRRLVERDRPARGDRPAHDGGDPARGPRAAARRRRRSPTGTSACCPSAATTPTSSPSRRTTRCPTCPQGWLESLLPRQVAAHDEGEPPAVRSYLGYLGAPRRTTWSRRCAR